MTWRHWHSPLLCSVALSEGGQCYVELSQEHAALRENLRAHTTLPQAAREPLASPHPPLSPTSQWPDELLTLLGDSTGALVGEVVSPD